MEVDWTHAGLGGEVGDTVTDADVALLLQLLLRLGEDGVRSRILELECSVRRLVMFISLATNNPLRSIGSA